ncbi:MAG: hypothetical protein IE913_02755 [Halothiobacillus sp.]|nr:hypothetical protein [Halothiobacillus sp.]
MSIHSSELTRQSKKQADQASTRRPTPFLTTRKLWAFALIAALAASTLAFRANHLEYDDLLVRIQAESSLGCGTFPDQRHRRNRT